MCPFGDALILQGSSKTSENQEKSGNQNQINFFVLTMIFPVICRTASSLITISSTNTDVGRWLAVISLLI